MQKFTACIKAFFTSFFIFVATFVVALTLGLFLSPLTVAEISVVGGVYSLFFFVIATTAILIPIALHRWYVALYANFINRK